MGKKILLSIFTFLGIYFSAQLPVSTTQQKKVALLEEYTGIYCVYCPDGHRIANELIDQYPNKFFAINIHEGGYANPDPGDPDFRTPFGTALANQTGITGYPSGTINRRLFNGNNTTILSRVDWQMAANTVMNEDSYVNIASESSLDIQSRQLTVTVQMYFVSNGPASMKLNVALLQNNIKGPQTGAESFNPEQVNDDGTYNHMHMLRHFLTGQWGDTITTTTSGTTITRTYNYTLPASINSIPLYIADIDVVCYAVEGNQNIINACNSPINYEFGNKLEADFVANYPANSTLKPIDCNLNITPKINVKNNNNNQLNSYTVSYSLDGTNLLNLTSNPLINSNDSVDVTFNNVLLTPGIHKHEFNIENTDTSMLELFVNNNFLKYTSVNFGTALTDSVYANFETLAQNLYNYDDNAFPINFKNKTIILNNGTSTYGALNSKGSINFNFFNAPRNTVDMGFYMNNINLTGFVKPELSFYYNHKRYKNEYYDTLIVSVSNDCGNTWTQKWLASGTSLSTNTSFSTNFYYPSSTKWVKKVIDLSEFIGDANVIVKFVGISDYGNNLYIDEVKISDNKSIGINDINNISENVIIYPNPAQDKLKISIEKEYMNVNVEIIDINGRIVNTYFDFDLQKEIDIQALTNGTYFIKLYNQEFQAVNKFVKN